jgi:hypothetical protein
VRTASIQARGVQRGMMLSCPAYQGSSLSRLGRQSGTWNVKLRDFSGRQVATTLNSLTKSKLLLSATSIFNACIAKPRTGDGPMAQAAAEQPAVSGERLCWPTEPMETSAPPTGQEAGTHTTPTHTTRRCHAANRLCVPDPHCPPEIDAPCPKS